MTRVLACGGRDFKDRERVWRSLDHLDSTHGIVTMIQGEAPGADQLAALWAIARKKELMCFPANWPKHGKSAGPIRNQKMLKEGRPDIAIAFPGGPGTADMVARLKKAGIEVIEG